MRSVRTYCIDAALVGLLLGSLGTGFLAAQEAPPAEALGLTVCYGQVAKSVALTTAMGQSNAISLPPVASITLTGTTTLSLFLVDHDAEFDAAAGPNMKLPVKGDYRFVLGEVATRLEAKQAQDLVISTKSGLGVRVRRTEVFGATPCETGENDGGADADIARIRRLRTLYDEAAKLLSGPDLKTQAEYAENAVIRIDALTGKVDPGTRIKIRRGHYVVVQIDNGYFVDLIHEQSLTEWNDVRQEGVTKNPRSPITSTVGLGQISRSLVPLGVLQPGEILLHDVSLWELQARFTERAESLTRDLKSSGLPIPDFSAILRGDDTTGSESLKRLAGFSASGPNGEKVKAELIVLVERARALEHIVSRLPDRAQSGWVRAAYRETVFRVRVIPVSLQAAVPTPGATGSEETAGTVRPPPDVKDIVFTLNAQKWGTGVGAGFLFAAAESTDYIYGPETNGKKKILESGSAAASPFPAVFLNLWLWERSQWGATIALGVETAEQRTVYGFGLSYLFSRHAQLTFGVALAPTERLPSGYSVNQEVPVADTTLQSLGTDYRFRFAVGLGWRFGAGGDPRSAAETEPSPR